MTKKKKKNSQTHVELGAYHIESPEISSLGFGRNPDDNINISMDHHRRLQPQHKYKY